MNLVFLHGPPAAGKLTVGREFARVTNSKLFDNHISIDFAKNIFEFGIPDRSTVGLWATHNVDGALYIHPKRRDHGRRTLSKEQTKNDE